MSLAILDAGPAEVLELLREQDELYGKLESLAARQRSFVSEASTAPLMALLADRQRIAVQLGEIASRLGRVRRRWQSFRTECTDGERAEVDELVNRSAVRLRRVIESDEEDARLLGVRKHAVAHALKETESVHSAVTAYQRAGTVATGARFTDGFEA